MTGHVSELSGTCPSIEFTTESTRVVTTASTQFGGKGCGDIANGTYIGVAGTRQEGGILVAKYVSVSPAEPSTPTPTPHTEPTATPTASPGDDHGGTDGELSFHGFYEGLTPGGALALICVDDNKHVQIEIIDAGGQTISFAEGPLTNGAFSLTLTTTGTTSGQPIVGVVTDTSIAVTLGDQTFQALRMPTFGTDHTVAGRYFGVTHGPDGAESHVMFVIDTNNNIVMIQTGKGTMLGGYGTITPPVAPATQYTFTLDKVVGSTSPITGNFTVVDGTFAGMFTTSAGTFTVNTFKSSLANHMANISTRGLVGPGQGQLIGGFIITGGPKLVLIRAIGPSLAAAGVSPVLSNPSLQLFSKSTLLASNEDWKSNTNAAQIATSGLAPSNDLESALLVRLEPGSYTTVVSGGTETGIALVEVYEAGD